MLAKPAHVPDSPFFMDPSLLIGSSLIPSRESGNATD